MISEVWEEQKYRHICNGLVGKIPGMISGAIGQLEITQERMMISLEIPVHNPDSTFTSFNHRFQVTKEEAELVKTAFHQEAGQTMYSIIQAYTSAANGSTAIFESRYKLPQIAGMILNF